MSGPSEILPPARPHLLNLNKQQTNWGLSAQIPKPIGNIFHLNYHVAHKLPGKHLVLFSDLATGLLVLQTNAIPSGFCMWIRGIEHRLLNLKGLAGLAALVSFYNVIILLDMCICVCLRIWMCIACIKMPVGPEQGVGFLGTEVRGIIHFLMVLNSCLKPQSLYKSLKYFLATTISQYFQPHSHLTRPAL